ncbi:hypothetical protein H8356DRAFT_1644365 [Neocallimastix lanati (nom. inval.)]|jgi:glucan phosphoethanolaminetransferase (alkaline phosphatase superfamily)|uniref:Uncharacterized protein n=1 Tax=Neocallimastix californiae TaxID=1754190 RepID=A0A1Y2AUU8_9FUNG|nr:hypothetical protein H8356DRAFT_1644365 [Neocallimastix sp. JGI-2020a]ORY26373.1 hypothetical protein LY90DRAFT_513797 [Neocallimastix californiae]|eukprot:ORY26373.1 hypothetical protein LY90DRAFT_513797 [Neocallimastix californiae]
MEQFNDDTIVIVNDFNLTQVFIRFNVFAYISFIGTLYLAYFLFRLILGRMFNYERHKKSPAKHYHHLVDTFIYGTVLFIFGNYSQSYSWITALCIIIGLFGFATICELPFCRVSLQSLRTWDIKLKLICAFAGVIIAAAAVYHIYLATQFKIDEDSSLVLPYVLSLIFICLFLFLSTFVVYKYQNMSFPSLKKRIIRVGERTKNIVMTRNEFEERQHDNTRDVINSDEVLFIDMPEVGFHLHHWQIFYYLAFFTRFDNVISEICAGLVIGIFMHGVSAYGFHDLLEE